MWVADLVHWPTPVPLNSKPCFFCFHCCRWWEAPAPQKTCGRRSTLGNINNRKRDMTWVQPWPLSWVLSCQRDVSYLSSQHPWCPGGVTGAFPPCPSESLEQELFSSAPYSHSWMRQFSSWQWSSIIIFSAYFCHFITLMFIWFLFSWWKQNTALCILSMSFCNISFLSTLVLAHLTCNWCYIWSLLAVCWAFWARIIAWGKMSLYLESNFPRSRSQNWFNDSDA